MKHLFKSSTIFYIIITLCLSLIGIIFSYSTGQFEGSGNSNMYIRQLIWVLVGIVIATIIIMIDYYYIVEMSFIYYLLGLGLLILTLVIGKEIKGARSWLGLGGMGIQASEVMKIAYIIFYAKYLSNKSTNEIGIKPFLLASLPLLPPLILILLQPDLGTAIVFIGIFLMMSLFGLRDISILKIGCVIGLLTIILTLSYAYVQFYYLPTKPNAPNILSSFFMPNTFIAIAAIFLFYAFITFIIDILQPNSWISKFTNTALIIGFSFLTTGAIGKILKPYQWNRLLVFIDPEFDRLGAGYNIIQSRIAIGAGGLLGQGLFNGTQNLRGFLPEKHTDFIFAIIAEETGFLGGAFVILLYMGLFTMIIQTMISAKDKEGSYIATGVLAMFSIHVLINIGMNLGVAPVTGLPLPFISYGGSSYISSIMAVALMINIYNRRFTN